ncbi:MAG: Spy/CpxP family protein refolding chaperone [Nitrospirota bacterium]|nr:Spy/CpxP family protein refolding chaperone [Nitrospirota bacterium]MDE3049992.1 Spy/CpxP family protein refolding chaperone [Nitrospirota bacterium]
MNSGMKTLLVVAVGMALLGVTIPSAWADGGSACRAGGHAFGMARHGMAGHGGMTSHVLRNLLRHQQDLALTDDQVTKLKALALDQDRAQIWTHADVEVAERELRALVADEKTELSVIEAKIKERESFEAKLSFMGIKAKRDLYAVLTPEQREKQKAIRDQMRQMHRARMFSSQGVDAADHEQTAGGMTPASESTPRDAERSLQTS